MNNINQFETTECLKCSADTKLFFDDVYKSGTRTKETQVKTVQCGRSMIEMLGVLAIVGVLSVGGIAGYSKAMEKFKINKTIDQVSHLVANIRTLYSQQTTYEGLDENTAIEMGVIPAGLTSGTNDIINPFNGQVRIMNTDSGDSFMVNFTNLPKEACVTLATNDWGSESSSGLIAIGVGYNSFTGPQYSYSGNCDNYDKYDTTVKTIACPGDKNNPTPINVATAANACSQCGEYGCSISWVFK